MLEKKMHPLTVNKVLLLKGGWNAERAVSLVSAKGVYDALVANGYNVLEYDLTRDISALITTLQDFNPDVVFLNALHGQDVEDGKIQSLMELLGYPYTGSDVTASANAFDKERSRQILSGEGVPLAKGAVLPHRGFFGEDKFETLSKAYGLPFVIKPLCEGSSVGVSLIKSKEDFIKASKTWSYGPKVLVESYIPGRELSVAVLDGRALDVLELCPSNDFYDYEAKNVDGVTEHIMPAELGDEDRVALLNIAEKTIRALGAEGLSRVDFRFDVSQERGQRAYVLEANTLPGMTPLSIAPEVAAYTGIDYQSLCRWIVEHPIMPLRPVTAVREVC